MYGTFIFAASKSNILLLYYYIYTLLFLYINLILDSLVCSTQAGIITRSVWYIIAKNICTYHDCKTVSTNITEFKSKFNFLNLDLIIITRQLIFKGKCC